MNTSSRNTQMVYVGIVSFSGGVDGARALVDFYPRMKWFLLLSSLSSSNKSDVDKKTPVREDN